MSESPSRPAPHCPVMVVLGGNAFVRSGRPLTMEGQFQFADEVLQALLPLFASDRSVVVTHGNGPQVGQMLTRVEAAAESSYRLPLEVCVAETQGELGYVLQQSLQNILTDNQIDRSVVGLLTQVEVAAEDPAFDQPTKPVGPVLSEEDARRLQQEGASVALDAGRGLRRVVASPTPLAIVETEVIRTLLEHGVVVIAAGGGGVPVLKVDGHLRGVAGVVDKDLASAVLGNALNAQEMIIITDVPYAYTAFQQRGQQPIEELVPEEARQLIRDGHFTAGSMLPKIEAACMFCERPGTRATICSLKNLAGALLGKSGTRMFGPDREQSECD